MKVDLTLRNRRHANRLHHKRADLIFFSLQPPRSVSQFIWARPTSRPTSFPSLARGFPPRRAIARCGRTSLTRNLFPTLAPSQTQVPFELSRVPVREFFPTFALSQTRTYFQPRGFLTPARSFPTCLSNHPSVARIALKTMSNLIFKMQIP